MGEKLFKQCSVVVFMCVDDNSLWVRVIQAASTGIEGLGTGGAVPGYEEDEAGTCRGRRVAEERDQGCQ